MAYPYSYYRNQVLAVHQEWIENLKQLTEITNPSARLLWIDDLRFIHRQASVLVNEPQLSTSDRALLQHIADRTIEEHLALLRASSSKLIAGF